MCWMLDHDGVSKCIVLVNCHVVINRTPVAAVHFQYIESVQYIHFHFPSFHAPGALSCAWLGHRRCLLLCDAETIEECRQ